MVATTVYETANCKCGKRFRSGMRLMGEKIHNEYHWFGMSHKEL